MLAAMDSFGPLFVLKVLLEQVVLPQTPVTAQQDSPLSARIHFLHLPPMEATSTMSRAQHAQVPSALGETRVPLESVSSKQLPSTSEKRDI